MQRRPLFGPPAQVPPHCEVLVQVLPASKPPTQTPAVQVPLLEVGQEPSSTYSGQPRTGSAEFDVQPLGVTLQALGSWPVGSP